MILVAVRKNASVREIPTTAAIVTAAVRPVDDVLTDLNGTSAGLSSVEAAARLASTGPNAIQSHKARGWVTLGRQLRSPILILLFVTAGVSVFLGESTNAIIIGVILIASVGLGFANEYRAERAADALHDQIRHFAPTLRDGKVIEVDVTELVPGDVVRLAIGCVVPADLRLLTTSDLACDEGILTGESMPAGKSVAAVSTGAGVGDLKSCALMGTIVQSGTATGVVVATGSRAEFGRIALGLVASLPQTDFQKGLGKFSLLLLEVAIALTTLIFVANILLQRPILDSLLFSLAIAVGITPQLLPAVVSASLAAGSRILARKHVLVKRLVCIEDLGDVDLLVTDKTGTLTEGRISFSAAIPTDGATSARDLFRLGLFSTEADFSTKDVSSVGLNPLDAALCDSPDAKTIDRASYRQLAVLPFDHERRMTSAVVADPNGNRVVSKGSPEDLLAHCVDVPPGALVVLDKLYKSGARVVAVAERSTSASTISAADEKGFALVGFLTFEDRPKLDAKESLQKLRVLGIEVKVATGDNTLVAEKVLSDLGMVSTGTLSGPDIDAMDDTKLGKAARASTIFARVSPEQKARIIRLLRHAGRSVAFMGDGVNDALALHQADVGISVNSATDVAKDAADVLLLDKDLGVLADGVMDGRRIFADTIKYVLMGTSSNFGNMFSASVASVVLPFLPMLPGQILLNNLLYDAGQLAIPGDRVDPEQLRAPSHWDIGYIRRFMFLFGPISSIFDFATFALMLFVFHAAQPEFQAGWFIESIATQTLIIFAIRTRRVPFLRSKASLGLTLASLGVVAVGIWLPFSPLATILGFRALPVPFFLALVGMVVAYLVVVEFAKKWFFSRPAQRQATAPVRRRAYPHRVLRRASRFTSRSPRGATAAGRAGTGAKATQSV
jgi:Mg2+-importing ATPase